MKADVVITVVGAIGKALHFCVRWLPGFLNDEQRKATLRAMLEHERYEWRSLAKLARAVGASKKRARELLVAIGARASTGDGEELWGLISRVGSSGVVSIGEGSSEAATASGARPS